MIPFFATWGELTAATGNVLVIINSPDGDEQPVGSVIEHVALQGAAVHVIAAASWRAWLAARGVPRDRVLLAVDDKDGDLELNHFLEFPQALAWVLPKAFSVVVGSAPHGRYNEEIKDLFEQRVSAFLRDGLFVAHALPELEVYVFDLASMFNRVGRKAKLGAYESASRGLVERCYQLWHAKGRPVHSDSSDFSDEIAALRTHLGDALLDFDERSPRPLPHVDAAGTAAAAMVKSLVDVVAARDRMLNIRVGEIAERDKIIESLQSELSSAHRRIKRRFWGLVR